MDRSQQLDVRDGGGSVRAALATATRWDQLRAVIDRGWSEAPSDAHAALVRVLAATEPPDLEVVTLDVVADLARERCTAQVRRRVAGWWLDLDTGGDPKVPAAVVADAAGGAWQAWQPLQIARPAQVVVATEVGDEPGPVLDPAPKRRLLGRSKGPSWTFQGTRSLTALSVPFVARYRPSRPELGAPHPPEPQRAAG